MVYSPLQKQLKLLMCPVCGVSSNGLEVGTRGRFNMSVRNIACDHCALVYQSPRPTREAMAEYYATGYREALR